MADGVGTDYSQFLRFFRQAMRDYHAPLPAEVVAVTDAQRLAGVADIRVELRKPHGRDTEGNRLFSNPVPMEDRMVLVPGTDRAAHSLRLEVGDKGLWIPTVFSMDTLRGSGAASPTSPESDNQQDLQHGFFVPLTRNHTFTATDIVADRTIPVDTTLNLGDGTGSTMAFKASVQTAINDVWFELGKIATALAAAGPGSLVYTVTKLTPSIAGTTKTKAS